MDQMSIEKSIIPLIPSASLQAFTSAFCSPSLDDPLKYGLYFCYTSFIPLSYLFQNKFVTNSNIIRHKFVTNSNGYEFVTYLCRICYEFVLKEVWKRYEKGMKENRSIPFGIVKWSDLNTKDTALKITIEQHVLQVSAPFIYPEIKSGSAK